MKLRPAFIRSCLDYCATFVIPIPCAILVGYCAIFVIGGEVWGELSSRLGDLYERVGLRNVDYLFYWSWSSIFMIQVGLPYSLIAGWIHLRKSRKRSGSCVPKWKTIAFGLIPLVMMPITLTAWWSIAWITSAMVNRGLSWAALPWEVVGAVSRTTNSLVVGLFQQILILGVPNAVLSVSVVSLLLRHGDGDRKE